MSLDGVEQVLERLASEPAFRDQLKSDSGVLDQFDLTADERQALSSWDREAVEALAVEERVNMRRHFAAKEHEPD